MEKQPYLECPRYFKCSVNSCPLHRQYPEMFTDPEDHETRCRLAKTVRTEIAGRYPGVLKFGGLTAREFAARKHWDSLSQEEKDRIVERTKKFHFVSASQRDVSQGEVRLPVAQVVAENTLKAEVSQ